MIIHFKQESIHLFMKMNTTQYCVDINSLVQQCILKSFGEQKNFVIID